jgi:predicted oxidoreductase
MQADEIAEAVEELKSEGKIIDFDFQTLRLHRRN